jgi:hypothetical protein
VFNIKKAVSCLPFAPKLKEIEITNIKNGGGVFVPLGDKSVSFAGLQEALKRPAILWPRLESPSSASWNAKLPLDS